MVCFRALHLTLVLLSMFSETSGLSLHFYHLSTMRYHWNENVIILMKVSSLAAPKVVILTTFGAASDEDFIKMMTFSFQCMAWVVEMLPHGTHWPVCTWFWHPWILMTRLGSRSHAIDQALPEYSGLSTRGVKALLVAAWWPVARSYQLFVNFSYCEIFDREQFSRGMFCTIYPIYVTWIWRENPYQYILSNASRGLMPWWKILKASDHLTTGISPAI